MNLFVFNRIALFVGALSLFCVLSAASAFSADSVDITLANGAGVRIYPPEVLEEYMRLESDGFAVLSLPSGEVYRLITDIDDPSIVNKGDGSFHPFRTEQVVEGLNEIDLDGARVDIEAEIYILPYPVSGYICSFVSGMSIYLSPGVYEPDEYITAYIVSHEFGHIFQHRYLPLEDEVGWERYLALRGIAQGGAGEAGDHAGRPEEIFAEDFRYLFGGDKARYSGGVENETLVRPDEVPGLREFFLSLIGGFDVAEHSTVTPFRVSNYPNPFNPATTVTAEFNDLVPADGGRVSLEVYGVDGRLVKRLQDGTVEGNRVSFLWDGTNERGIRVTSGTYFYVISAGRERTAGKMIMVR